MLGSIQTPTLVVTADAYTAAAAENDGLTTYLVEHIPGARLLALHGQDFVPFGGDPTTFVEAIADFVDKHHAKQAEFDRVLATVLFTDIVGKADDGTIRIVEVWDTREQAEAFGEKVRAARQEMGIGGPTPPVEYLQLHSLTMPQQAPA